jgi:hypothetical protein
MCDHVTGLVTGYKVTACVGHEVTTLVTGSKKITACDVVRYVVT